MQSVRKGDELWEVDGHKWYGPDVKDFPYFHGYPAADVWSEYNGTETRLVTDPATGRFTPRNTNVGNHQDRSLTLGYGKYAVFLVKELDLSGCEEHTLEHRLRRDRLFINFVPVTFWSLSSPRRCSTSAGHALAHQPRVGLLRVRRRLGARRRRRGGGGAQGGDGGDKVPREMRRAADVRAPRTS